MKYFTKFANHVAYQAYVNGSTYITPNVSLCASEREIHFNPYVPDRRVIAKYNVTSTSSATTLLYSSGSGTSAFSLMEVDGVEVTPTSSYTFDTTGEHTVKFILADGVTSIGDSSFRGCSGLTSITIPDSVTLIGEYAFSGCSGLTNVIIPDSVTLIGDSAFSYCSGLISVTIGNSVTSIGDYAFRGCSGLTSVTIPDSVTLIGEHAFYDCSGLTSLTIGNSVTSIDNYAFRYCSGLTSITIPNSVTSIGLSVFGGCSGLTSISVDVNNQTYDSRNNCNAIIETSTNTLVAGCKNTIIPGSVTSIGSNAFFGCSELTSVTISNSVTSIGQGAFCNCSGLTSINIPDSVTLIGEYAFQGCSDLTSVTIGNSVTSMSGVFYGCSGLTNIICNATTAPSINYRTFQNVKTNGILTVPAGSTGYDVWMGTGGYYLGYYNWTKVEVLEGNQVLCKYNVTSTSNATNLLYSSGSGTSTFSLMEIDGIEMSVNTSYTFNTTGEHTVKFIFTNGVTSIGDSTFRGCSGLTSVTIGNSVTSIGNLAFINCTSLTSITIPDSVTSIGNQALQNCSILTSITIPDSVTSIGDSAFYECSGLTSISVATNNQTFDSRNNCNAIIETSTNTLIVGCKNTVISNSVTSIGQGAFSGCSGLTSVTIPNSVTSIGNYAFFECSGLTNITIPNSVTSIGNSVFFDCSGLISVTIGNSVTSIGDDVFGYCSGLTNIICNALTAPTIQSITFQNIKWGGTLTVPAGSTGYDVWMGTGNYYLGKYNWTKVEQ